MEAPVYLENGQRLFKIFNNIIIEIDTFSYQFGIMACNAADIRTGAIDPGQDAKPVAPDKFNKHYKDFLHFANSANNDTGGKLCQIPLMPPCESGAADRLPHSTADVFVYNPEIIPVCKH